MHFTSLQPNLAEPTPASMTKTSDDAKEEAAAEENRLPRWPCSIPEKVP